MGARSHRPTWAGTIHLVRKLVSEAGAWKQWVGALRTQWTL